MQPDLWDQRAMALECYVSLYGNNVVGPEEYKELVDNHAYTNYLVLWTIT